jgi:NAD-dependent SIR2 family protein deacetylase
MRDALFLYPLSQPLFPFQERPEAFCALAKEMWPGNFKPTPTHFFIKLLEQKGVLRRCFTQVRELVC